MNNIRTLKRSYSVVGAYVSDSNQQFAGNEQCGVWLKKNDHEYLPVLNLLHFDAHGAFTFASTRGNVNANVESYNTNQPGANLMASVVNKTRINTSVSDLLVGGVTLALNFTGVTLTITGDDGIARAYPSVYNERMGDFQGCLVIMKITTLTCPQYYQEQSGVAGYLGSLARRLQDRADSGAQQLAEMYRFLHDKVSLAKENGFVLNGTPIKVVSALSLSAEEIAQLGRDETIRLWPSGSLVSRQQILNMPEHPALHQDTALNSAVVESVREHGFSCFIVDNHDAISPRYISFAGQVQEVPRIKDLQRPEGLYIVRADAHSSLSTSSVIPLDQLSQYPHLYSDRESAAVGADLRRQFERSTEMEKLEETRRQLTLKAEQDRLNHQNRLREQELQDETTRLRAEFEQAQRQAKLDAEERERERKLFWQEQERKRALEHEQAMRAIKEESERAKSQADQSKHYHDQHKYYMDSAYLGMKSQHDERKFERDGLVESLKTVGAVAGLAVAGIAVYNRLSS